MRIVLLGFGGIGRALARLLEERRAALYAECGLWPRLVAVVDSRGAAVSERGLDAAALIEAKDAHGTVAAVPGHGVPGAAAEAIVEATAADTVVEATPTRLASPREAFERLKAAFRTGKHAVSVNKAPLATALPALLELARYNRVEFRFSGTVGGGTPILAWARECARGDEVLRVRGVLNGTTNFILHRMTAAGEGFDAALAEAMRLGYAETDPSTDIDGIDTATKLVILANWVLGRPATLRDVAREGIRGLPAERVRDAAGRGRVVKLVGEIGAGLSVSPQEVPRGDPLDVPGTLNAVTLTLRASGDVTLSGRGAGGPETATAILRDLMDLWHAVGGK